MYYSYSSCDTHTQGTLSGSTGSPETVNGGSRLGHLVVSGQQPETEDRLSKDVQNGIGNNLAVDTDDASAIGDTPDAKF